jgi:hypothetical protein
MSPLPSRLLALVLFAVASLTGWLHAAPTITQQPQATVIVTSGQAAAFSAQATGTGPIRWQWRRMGGALIGQTGPSLTLPAATMAEVGFYDVVATDDTGSVASRPSSLLVTPVGGYPDTLRLDTSFNPTFERNSGALTNGVIAAPGGSVYLFGRFSHIAGKPVAGIARFTPDLVIDPTFRPAVSGSVGAVAIQADGKLILDARVRLADGQLMGPLVRLHTDGSYDATFNLAALTDQSGSTQPMAHAALPDGNC